MNEAEIGLRDGIERARGARKLEIQESLRGKLLSLFIHLKDRKRFVHLLTRLGELVVPRTEKFDLWNDKDGSVE